MDGKVYIDTLHHQKTCLSWHSLNEKFDIYLLLRLKKKQKIKKNTQLTIHPDSANLFISIRQGVKISMCETSKVSSVVRCAV